MAASLWEETDSELELPATWQEAIRTDGVVLYQNAATGEFQRAHPISGRVKTVSTALPPDWYFSIDGSGRTTFINSVTGRISYADPRLATTSTSGPISLSKGFTKSRFDRFSVVDELFVSLNIPLHICIMASDCFPPGATYFCLGTILSNLSTIRGRLMSLLRPSAFCALLHFVQLHKLFHWFLADRCECRVEFGGCGRTSDGFELSMQKNYLAQVLLLRCLSRPLAQACEECKDPDGRPRIVFLSGDSHRYAALSDAQDAWLSRSLFYSTPSGFMGALSQYATSKLCQLSFLFELQQRIRKWHQESVDTGFSPLLCACNAENLLAVRCSGLWYRSLMEIPCNFILLLLRLARWILSPFLQSLTQAAATPCFCVTDTSLIHWNTQTHGGSSRNRLLYLDAFHYQPPSSHITNRVNSRTLWEHTNSILDEYDDNTDGWKPLIGPDRTC